jgi:hypothetical protein
MTNNSLSRREFLRATPALGLASLSRAQTTGDTPAKITTEAKQARRFVERLLN